MTVTGSLNTSNISVTGATQILRTALELVPPDSHQAGLLLPRYVRVLGWQNADYEGAHQAFLQGLAIAQRESDPSLEMAMLVNAALVDLFHLHFHDSLEKYLGALEMAREANDLEGWAGAHRFAATNLLIMGELERARSQAAAALVADDKTRNREWSSITLSINSDVARLEGEWRVARDFSERGLLLEPHFPLLLGTRVLLECEQGDFEHGDMYLRQLVEAIRLGPPGPNWESSVPAMVIPIVARITGNSDQIETAEAAAETVVSSPSVSPIHAASARMGLALIAISRGEVASAKMQYKALETLRGLMAPWMWICTDRVLGLLSHTLGDLNNAAEYHQPVSVD